MTKDKNEPGTLNQLIPVSKWDQFFPDPTPSALRWMIFSDKEFAKQCVVRRKRRVLIDAKAYHKWLQGQQIS